MRYVVLFGSLLVVVSGCGDDESASGGAGGSSANGTGAGGAGGAMSGPMSASIDGYALRFDVESSILKSSLTLSVAQAGSCFTVPSEHDVTEASFDGEPATATRDGANLTLCGPWLEVGPHALEVVTAVPKKTYLGLDVGYSSTVDRSGADFSYLLSWVGGCDHFGPCDDAPDRLVDFRYDVTHPAGVVALCPGTRTIVSPTETHCEIQGAKAPTYSAYGLALDPAWEEAPFVSAAGVDVSLFEVPGGTLHSSIDAASLGAFLTWSTQRFGPLPFGSALRLAGGPTYWLGFEHPANIVLQEALGDLALPYQAGAQHVTMHEITHQWAGDAATITTAQDFAWKEAIAEYIPYVYEDEARPVGEAAASRAYWDGISIGAAYHVRPTDEPPPEVQSFYGDVYGPGPMTLFVQLEPLIGRDAVLAGIAQFLEGGGARSVADLQAALEAASGEDLGDYFDAWVFGAGAPVWPAFSVSSSDAGNGQVQVTVDQVQPGGVIFPARVEVRLEGATSQAIATLDFGLHPTSGSVSVTIPFAEAVLSTTIDPDHRVIDTSPGVARSSWPVFLF